MNKSELNVGLGIILVCLLTTFFIIFDSRADMSRTKLIITLITTGGASIIVLITLGEKHIKD